jgi:UDP-N-acetylglucosamine/UDP-N-acetylgalactosamine diphosphorylase
LISWQQSITRNMMEDHNLFSSRHYDGPGNRSRVNALAVRGVQIWGPERVYIAPEVPLAHIEPGAVLMNAILLGEETRVGRAAVIGLSGTAVLNDTQIANDVEVGAGYYDGATLLTGAKTRGYAELRPGTLLEETSEIGHNVGLKNALLTAGVVIGSNVNFCDIVVGGGTSRRDHSEIGSGAMHLNFDPRGDKFGSLLGDARTVLLHSRRIFVGGNTALVAPVRVNFGAVVPAGLTLRTDLQEGVLASVSGASSQARDFDPEIYFDLRRKVVVTSALVGALHAIERWYEDVRIRFCDGADRPLYQYAVRQIRRQRTQRLRELERVFDKLEMSILRSQHRNVPNPFIEQHTRLIQNKSAILDSLAEAVAADTPRVFMDAYERRRARDTHHRSIVAAGEDELRPASQWLMGIQNNYTECASRWFASH